MGFEDLELGSIILRGQLHNPTNIVLLHAKKLLTAKISTVSLVNG
jgi:hypothetical protein